MDFDILDISDSSSSIDDNIEEVVVEENIVVAEEYVDTRYDNLLDDNIYAKCLTDTVGHENLLLTEPENTTNTINGHIINASLHEEQLIKIVVPDEIVVEYRCNYGIVTHKSYVPKEKVRKTNRGRKKKPRVKKNRKQQGSGTELNSQITMVIKMPDDSVIKPKIFRNGKVSIPGLKLVNLHYVCETIISRMQLYYPTCEWNSVNLSMSNYRWKLKLPDGVFINMAALADIISKCVTADRTQDPALLREFSTCENRPTLFDSKIIRENAKLSVKIRARTKVLNTILLNIFRRGRTNIQGIYDVELISRIRNFMYWIFENYPVMCYQNNLPVPQDNVDNEGAPYVPHQYL